MRQSILTCVCTASLLPLFCGATLVLPSKGRFSPRFWEEASRHGITQVIVVPKMLKLLLMEAEERSPPLSERLALRLFWSIGSALTMKDQLHTRNVF